MAVKQNYNWSWVIQTMLFTLLLCSLQHKKTHCSQSKLYADLKLVTNQFSLILPYSSLFFLILPLPSSSSFSHYASSGLSMSLQNFQMGQQLNYFLWKKSFFQLVFSLQVKSLKNTNAIKWILGTILTLYIIS